MNASPGDLVVCVNAGPCPECLPGLPLGGMVAGRVYTVAAFWPDEKSGGYDLEELPPDPVFIYCAPHFRKLNDEADDAKLIARIKSCQPQKIGEPA